MYLEKIFALPATHHKLNSKSFMFLKSFFKLGAIQGNVYKSAIAKR